MMIHDKYANAFVNPMDMTIKIKFQLSEMTYSQMYGINNDLTSFTNDQTKYWNYEIGNMAISQITNPAIIDIL